jgi:hypothetical protein
MMRPRILVVIVGAMVLMSLAYGCQKMSSPAKKHSERDGSGQAQTTTPESSVKTHASSGSAAGSAAGGAAGGTPRKELVTQSEADCRLVLYVADKNMGRKEAEAFSKLLTEMIRSLESLSWPEGQLRNAALDHLAVPRYGECKHTEEGSLENSKRSHLV